MPQKIDLDIEWEERFAYWPTRSSWSKKRIWWKKYYYGQIYFDAMGRPPIKAPSWKLIYTEHEYLLMLLREDTNYQHPLYNAPGRSGPKPGY